jgi:hypothetical protein
MVAGPPDYRTPQHDLDVPAARRAEAHFRAALAGGSTERAAWDEAVELFRMHHPAWPRPLAESEAVRLIGGLIGMRRIDTGEREGENARTPPMPLLRRLARPARPEEIARGCDMARRPSPARAAPSTATLSVAQPSAPSP